MGPNHEDLMILLLKSNAFESEAEPPNVIIPKEFDKRTNCVHFSVHLFWVPLIQNSFDEPSLWGLCIVVLVQIASNNNLLPLMFTVKYLLCMECLALAAASGKSSSVLQRLMDVLQSPVSHLAIVLVLQRNSQEHNFRDYIVGLARAHSSDLERR
eukprot:2184784-Amphidinium_carterae.1